MRRISAEFLFNMTAVMWQPIVFGTTSAGRVTFPSATGGRIARRPPGRIAAADIGAIGQAQPGRFCLVLLAHRADVSFDCDGVSIAKPLRGSAPWPDRVGECILRRARVPFGMSGINT